MDRTWKYLIFIMTWMLFGVAIIFGQILPLMLPFSVPDLGAMLFLACLCWWFIGTVSFSMAEGTF